jgi:hypothetical protein
MAVPQQQLQQEQQLLLLDHLLHMIGLELLQADALLRSKPFEQIVACSSWVAVAVAAAARKDACQAGSLQARSLQAACSC